MYVRLVLKKRLPESGDAEADKFVEELYHFCSHTGIGRVQIVQLTKLAIPQLIDNNIQLDKSYYIFNDRTDTIDLQYG